MVESRFSSNYSKLHSDKQRKSGKKPSLGKRQFTDQGYTEPEQWDSDIEDGTEKRTTMAPVKMRLYFLSRADFMMLRACAVTVAVTWFLWFPWIIARFKWNYEPYESMVEGFEEFSIIFMMFSTVVIPVVYFVVNPYLRHAVRKTLLSR